MQDLDWNALRLVLAIARSGSLAGAARGLGVAHATIFRRLNAVEQRIGVSLFERARSGYRPTAAGADMVAAAERIEREVIGVEQRVLECQAQPSGTVRLTTTDTLFEGLLAAILADCRRDYPDIALEVAVSNDTYSLTRRQADMAVRAVNQPPEHLVGWRLGQVAMAVYTQANAAPRAAYEWVGLDDSVYFPALEAWLAERGDIASRCGYRLDTLLGLRAALRHGAGRGVLPCYLGDSDPDLVRVDEPIETLGTDLWLLVHPDLKRVARIRAVRDLLFAAFSEPEYQQALAGRAMCR
ncbi:LysR family transcriptional regulator [Salinisphaera sp. SPP-AMP-43]|uniref:LysR family transcriptional regulator n=1 Tax=Salinisphaera sp. SPP-AMP-43 TaxID=3121288 RepID=UPI003C6E40EA